MADQAAFARDDESKGFSPMIPCLLCFEFGVTPADAESACEPSDDPTDPAGDDAWACRGGWSWPRGCRVAILARKSSARSEYDERGFLRVAAATGDDDRAVIPCGVAMRGVFHLGLFLPFNTCSGMSCGPPLKTDREAHTRLLIGRVRRRRTAILLHLFGTR
ncbi:MAG: hypothetical protein AB8F26_10430 [Phycisphaerales bacterium]